MKKDHHYFIQKLRKIWNEFSFYRRISSFFVIFCVSAAFSLIIVPFCHSNSVIFSQTTTPQLIQQGERDYRSGDFEQAGAIWQKLAERFAESGDALNQAMALSNLSLVKQKLGLWDDANQAIAQSTNLLNSLPKTPEKRSIYAATLEIDGQLKLASGDPQQALNLWKESEAVYQNLPDINHSRIIANQINQAQAMQSLGLYPQACQTLLSSLGLDDQSCQISKADLSSLTTDHSDISLQILSLRSLSKVLRVIGKLEESQQVLQKSLLLTNLSGNQVGSGAIYLELGNTAHAFALQATPSQQEVWLTHSSRIDQCTMSEIDLDKINPNQLAIACYRQAAADELSQTSIQAQLNLLTLAIQASQWREVQSLLNQLPPALDRLPVSGSAIDARLKFSQALMCLRSENTLENRQVNSPLLQSCPTINHEDFIRADLTVPSWDGIRQQINIAQSQAKILGNQRIAATATGYLAATYQQQQAWGTAQQLTERALQNQSAYNNPEWVYLWQWQLGRLYRQQNQSENAIAAYTLSWRILQSLRQELVATNTDVQYAFRERVEPVYRELADLLLQPSQNPTEKSEKNQPRKPGKSQKNH